MCVKCEPSILWFQTQACLKQEPVGLLQLSPGGGLAPVASVSEREGLEWPFDSPKSGGGGWGKNRPVIRHSVKLGKAQSQASLELAGPS